jgi:hypothetical protein
MANSSPPNSSSTPPEAQTHGTTEIRQKNIGRMIAQGFPVKYVAKKLNMSESRIYHLLSDKESIVNAEINQILGQLFTGNDRHMVKLFNQTLEKLQTMLSSKNEEEQLRAMDRIIKIYMARSSKNGVTVQQYFGLEPPGQKEFTIDDYIKFGKKMNELIMQKRRERGLEPPAPEDSSNSAPENSASPASPSPTPVSETAASNESSPDHSPPDTSTSNESPPGYASDITPEMKQFLDGMNEPLPSE